MKTAIVHDWLTTYGGAERVLVALLDIFPDADIYSLIYFPEKFIGTVLEKRSIKTSWLQKLTRYTKNHRLLLPLMPQAIESLDLHAYDLVISSSFAVAKGIKTGPDQYHVAYIHSPMRYAWDMENEYLEQSRIGSGISGLITRYMLHRLRIWDVTSSHSVDHFIANSSFVARRIKKYYQREAVIINPPVNIEEFPLVKSKFKYYVTSARLVSYKRLDLIVSAFNNFDERELIVMGEGPQLPKIKSLAGPNVQVLGFQKRSRYIELISNARAFIFIAREDFGIAPVEAQAAGTPVIAYGAGGALETVVDGKTGVLFYKQDVISLREAIHRFENMSVKLEATDCRTNAELFNEAVFKRKMLAFIKERIGNI